VRESQRLVKLAEVGDLVSRAARSWIHGRKQQSGGDDETTGLRP
jgi:hypothetical protein